MNFRTYRKNRSLFPFSELIKYRGQWVAFSEDGTKIIANNEDLAVLDALVVARGEDPEKIALERIEEDDVCLGGAELQ
jgi:hypothetical protein